MGRYSDSLFQYKLWDHSVVETSNPIPSVRTLETAFFCRKTLESEHFRELYKQGVGLPLKQDCRNLSKNPELFERDRKRNRQLHCTSHPELLSTKTKVDHKKQKTDFPLNIQRQRENAPMIRHHMRRNRCIRRRAVEKHSSIRMEYPI